MFLWVLFAWNSLLRGRLCSHQVNLGKVGGREDWPMVMVCCHTPIQSPSKPEGLGLTLYRGFWTGKFIFQILPILNVQLQYFSVDSVYPSSDWLSCAEKWCDVFVYLHQPRARRMLSNKGYVTGRKCSTSSITELKFHCYAWLAVFQNDTVFHSP